MQIILYTEAEHIFTNHLITLGQAQGNGELYNYSMKQQYNQQYGDYMSSKQTLEHHLTNGLKETGRTEHRTKEFDYPTGKRTEVTAFLVNLV